ncbi:hypothetical protein NGRA_2628 [Nosema granulosis]|uniref:Uncharacterized protein n=1 Tax=Nosema granulosis TaxID=83296 RepID=A0A9P6GX15_9MICR|nr:hypothetical protein NGRA_2628 [Nosema granulosis]
MKLNNDLSMFVDIMYYDFILYKIVEVYRNTTGDCSTSDEYFDIASKLCKKFKTQKISLDSQIALKIMYIKFKRMLKMENCPEKTTPFCCDHHISVVLKKGFDCLVSVKQEYPAVMQKKIFVDLNILVASLVFVYFREYSKKDDSKELMIAVHNYLKTHKIEITSTEDFLRLKDSLFNKLGMVANSNFGEKMIIAIENMLEKTFQMFKEPFLYTLSVEKVTDILRKHDKMFKSERETLNIN